MRGNLSGRQDVGVPAFNGASVRALRRLGLILAAAALLGLAPAPVSRALSSALPGARAAIDDATKNLL